MAKVIKVVAIIAVAVAIVVFAPQISAFLSYAAFSAGASFAAAASIASALTTALVGIAISAGISAGMSLLRPKASLTQATQDRLNSSVVPTAARKIVFGRTCAGNDVRFEEQYGSKKDGYVRVVALASHKINAFVGFYVENELSYHDDHLDGIHIMGFRSFQYVKEGKPGNGYAVGSHSYWTASSTFTGCAYYTVDYLLGDKWPSGIPQSTKAIVEGCPLYDPRRDSTRGGSGSHRYDDQNTWAFYDGSTEIGRNPALALLTYLIGYKINGVLVWGMGIPISRINLASFRTYANLCEERVALQDGSTVQRYTADGILATTDSHETNINAIVSSMGSAKMVDLSGLYALIGGYDDTLGPKQSFSESDLDARYSWSPAGPSRETFNIVRGRFADPAALYQLSDWGEIDTDALADGVPRTLSLDLPMVSRAETCQRIAKQFLLREAKTPGTFVGTFGPRAFAVTVGSLCTLSLGEQGWNNKLFRVISQSETHDAIMQMTLREESPEIYAWDREEKPLPATIRPPAYDPTTTITPTGLSLTTQSFAGANDIDVSEVVVHWDAETSGRVVGIQIESRPAGATAWSEQAALHDPSTGTFTFGSNAPGVAIEVQARFRMSVTGIYSPWVTASITTQAVTVRPAWSNVTGNDRPADNATNTRDLNTPLGTGGQTVGGLITRVTNVENTVSNSGGAAAGYAQAAQAAQHGAETAQHATETIQTDVKNIRDGINVDYTNVKQSNDNLVAQVAGTVGSGLKSTIDSNKLTAASDTKTVSDKLDTLSSSVNDPATGLARTRADQSVQNTTFANADTALSNRATKLETRTAIRPNLLPNGSFEHGLTGWTNQTSKFTASNNGVWGSIIYANQVISGTGTIESDHLPCGQNAPYTISGDIEFYNSSSGTVYLDLLFFDGAGNVVLDGTEHQRGPGTGFSVDMAGPDFFATTVTSPANAVTMMARCVWTNIGATGNLGFRRIKVEFGTGNTPYTAEGTLNEFNARITNTETAYTDGRFATAGRATTLEAQLAGTSPSNLNSRLSNAEQAYTDGRFATSLRVSSLEATASAPSVTSINPNPTFDIWSNASQPPSGWQWWDQSAGIRRDGGQNGHSYAAAFDLPTANQNSGIQTANLDAAFGAYILTVSGRATTWQGAGALVYWGDTGIPTAPESMSINCSVDPDTSGYASPDGGGGAYRRTWSKYYKTGVNGGLKQLRVYAMASWDGFGARAAKSISFDEVSIRPATAAEIAAQRADANATSALARIGVVEQATTDGRFASASSVTTLNSQINGAGGVSATASAAYNTSVDAQNKLASARITLAATAGDGRAQFSLSSDGHDGRWALVGDGQIDGNLTVNGTLTTSKYANNSVTDGDGFGNNNVVYGQGNVSATGGGYSVSGGSYYDPDSGQYVYAGGWQDIVNNTVPISSNGRFSVEITFKQDFQSSSQAWACELYINGNLIDAAWGNYYQDKMILAGTISVGGPANVNYQVRWAANGNTNALNPRGKWEVRYK